MLEIVAKLLVENIGRSFHFWIQSNEIVFVMLLLKQNPLLTVLEVGNEIILSPSTPFIGDHCILCYKLEASSSGKTKPRPTNCVILSNYGLLVLHQMREH
jgi:hypothetical protein